MIWYKYLYLGETAKKHRFSILQKLRLGKVQPGVHVITPASGGHNLLDILPAYVLRQNYYREQADLHTVAERMKGKNSSISRIRTRLLAVTTEGLMRETLRISLRHLIFHLLRCRQST